MAMSVTHDHAAPPLGEAGGAAPHEEDAARDGSVDDADVEDDAAEQAENGSHANCCHVDGGC
jgi:hypothetical protein